MLLYALVGLVMAAEPNPDRPSVSRSGWLIAQNTLEIETGLVWTGGSRSAPTLLKLRPADPVEVRVNVDLSGVDAARPGLEAGTKIRLAETDQVGFAAFLNSAVPVNAGEPWFGTAQGLLSTQVDRVVLQANGGVDLVGTAGGIRYAGLPVVGLVDVKVASGLWVFGELAGVLGAPGCGRAACNGILDGGIAWLVTDSTFLDGGLGWDLDNGLPILQAGLTANFGVVRPLSGRGGRRASMQP